MVLVILWPACAEYSLRAVNPDTLAQFFHLTRPVAQTAILFIVSVFTGKVILIKLQSHRETIV